MSAATERALDYVRSLSGEGFWGTLALKFQHGEIVHLTKEESLQPNQLGPEYRRNDDRTHTNR
jgi:hypothetical protein